jgi:hypothetical protein
MSYVIEAWKADGPNGEARIASHTLCRTAETDLIVTRFKQLPHCVHVTKTRTDGRDAVCAAEHRAGKHRFVRKVVTLWQRPGAAAPL